MWKGQRWKTTLSGPPNYGVGEKPSSSRPSCPWYTPALVDRLCPSPYFDFTFKLVLLVFLLVSRIPSVESAFLLSCLSTTTTSFVVEFGSFQAPFTTYLDTLQSQTDGIPYSIQRHWRYLSPSPVLPAVALSSSILPGLSYGAVSFCLRREPEFPRHGYPAFLHSYCEAECVYE